MIYSRSMRPYPRPRRRGPALLVSVAVAGAGMLAGCGEEEGEPIPTRSARTIVKRLDEVERRIDAGNACNDIREDSLPALRREVARLSKRTDEDVRTTLEDGIGRLAELVEAECVEPRERDPEPEPEPEPEPQPEIEIPTTPEPQPEPVPDYPDIPQTPDGGGGGGGGDDGGGDGGGGNDGGGGDGGNDGGGGEGGGGDGGGGADGRGESGFVPGNGSPAVDSDAAAEGTAARPATRGGSAA